MYLVPSPMRPDTFSQYGYADAANLRALRRGYGHDIYPQYPTTYDMPRVIAGLGAFKHKGFTVDYYANAGTLSFADKNLRNLYEGLRNADIEFQKNATFVVNAISPAFGVLEAVSAGKIRADDVKKALRLKLPTWGVALVLEVAAGKRPVDQAFRAAMKECAKDMQGARAAFAVITGINGVLAVAGVPPSPAAPVLGPAIPVTAALAGIAGSATALTFILEPIYKALGTGKSPSRKEMKQMMEASAKLSGQKVPSSAQIDKMVADFDKAMKAPPTKAKAPASTETETVNPALQAKREAAQPDVSDASPPAPKPFPIVPVVLGAGALAAVLFVATRKGK